MLRVPERADFDAWADFCADPEQARFLGGAMPREVAWRDFSMRTGMWLTRDFSMFSVIERATGAWVGRIGPWQPEGWPGTEVGWGVARACAAMDYAVDVLGWSHIIHTIDPANTPSIRLAERLGSINGGRVQLPPPLESLQVDAWGQDAAAWRARRG